MLCEVKVAVYSEIGTKHTHTHTHTEINALCGKNLKFLNVKPKDTYSNC
jgi:hypothetical protein